MAQLKSQSYPKLAKAILAVFVLIAAFGPSIMQSADRKTRAHITATGSRPQPKSETEKVPIASLEESEAEKREEDVLVERLAERFFSQLKAEEARLERKLGLAEEKLEKQLREKERRAQKELARQLAEEERRTRKEIEKRLEEKLEESEEKMIERLKAEERVMAIALQEKLAEEKRLAEEALKERLAKEEEAGVQEIQAQLNGVEVAPQKKREARLAEEELAARRKIEKEIAAQARSARKQLKKRLDERERLARAEVLAQVEQERAAALEELEKKIRGEELAKKAALQSTLAKEEREALAEINRRLEAEKSRLGERKLAEDERKALDLAEKRTKRADRKSIGKTEVDKAETALSAKQYQNDDYKRPSLWTSFSRAPRQLLAGMGSFSFPKKEEYPGYLAFRAPPPLRFSDNLALSKRPPAQALPEFSILAPGRGSLMVETRLSEEEARKLALMNQIVVELEPHTIISGSIDTTIPREGDEAERLLIEESDDPVVRPEEVLIFFENGGDGNNTRTIVPFSPAMPSQKPPTRSGATYNRN